jgi:hypothetical protein
MVVGVGEQPSPYDRKYGMEDSRQSDSLVLPFMTVSGDVERKL